MTLSVFLPCRKGSQRVPKKNIKSFAGYKNGLVELKLKQLNNVNEIDCIVLSTDDEQIIKFANSLNNSKIKVHKRESSLASNEASTDNLVSHALSLIPKGDILWTHVTSPFINSKLYRDIIKKYFSVLNKEYDSLMTVTSIRSFLWNYKGPINYSRRIEKWPRTQTLNPLFEVNSGIFLANAEIYKKENDRIGSKPFLYELNKFEGFDIDENEDFEIANILKEIQYSNE